MSRPVETSVSVRIPLESIAILSDEQASALLNGIGEVIAATSGNRTTTAIEIMRADLSRERPAPSVEKDSTK